MPFLPSLRVGSNLLDVFKMFPKTGKPCIGFHEVPLRRPRGYLPLIEMLKQQKENTVRSA